MRLGVVVGFNHCISLFDDYLIKENHILSAGGIAKAVAKAKKNQILVKLLKSKLQT